MTGENGTYDDFFDALGETLAKVEKVISSPSSQEYNIAEDSILIISARLKEMTFDNSKELHVVVYTTNAEEKELLKIQSKEDLFKIDAKKSTLGLGQLSID